MSKSNSNSLDISPGKKIIFLSHFPKGWMSATIHEVLEGEIVLVNAKRMSDEEIKYAEEHEKELFVETLPSSEGY